MEGVVEAAGGAASRAKIGEEAGAAKAGPAVARTTKARITPVRMLIDWSVRRVEGVVVVCVGLRGS